MPSPEYTAITSLFIDAQHHIPGIELRPRTWRAIILAAIGGRCLDLRVTLPPQDPVKV